jgi:uncharacterized protein involved in exopolysaccharide biosynthesis
LVLACAVVLALVGLAGGAVRKSTYTAAATLQVGKVNPNSPGFYGFVQSASELATGFSRAITAAPVLRQVHRRLGLSRVQAAARLSAEPIPSSPVFRVIGTGPTPKAAIDLANVTARALVAYETRSNSYNPDTKRRLYEYHAAALKLARANAQVKEATRQYASYPFAKQREALEREQAAQAAASLEQQALANSYQLSAQSTTTGLMSLLAGAVTASSDHGAKMQMLALLGLLGGLVIGCALAVTADKWPRLRPSRRVRPSWLH